MPFEKIKSNFGFEQSGDYITVKTDFEYIKINCSDSERYSLTENNLIRFINEELLDDYPCDCEINGVYFLPTHKMDDFLDSLDSETILPELLNFYTQEMVDLFEKRNITSSISLIIKHKDRAIYGTSLYGADAATLEELVAASQQLLKLNSMKGYKIATGAIINNEIGLLERSSKDKSTTPKSRHYNFWKFDKALKNFEFADVAKEFEII